MSYPPQGLAAPSMPYGLITMWHGLIVNIPPGWVICDGNNSTPNLLTKFVEGVATAATDPGTTGGATAKTTAGHQHTSPVAQNSTSIGIDSPYGTGESQTMIMIGGGSSSSETTSLSKSATDSISDIRPKYYDIAFLMKT